MLARARAHGQGFVLARPLQPIEEALNGLTHDCAITAIGQQRQLDVLHRVHQADSEGRIDDLYIGKAKQVRGLLLGRTAVAGDDMDRSLRLWRDNQVHMV